MFLLAFIASVSAVRGKVTFPHALYLNLGITTAGVVFSGRFALDDLRTLIGQGLSASPWVISTCTFGLVLFADTVERFVPAKKGRKHILRIIDELLTFEPQSKKSHLDPALNFLSSMLKHGSVIIFASDFFAKFDKKKLQVLARKHDFICLRATDPRDQELPDVGLIRIEDPETGENMLLPTQSFAVRKAYADSQRKLAHQISDTIKKSGASLVDIATHADPVQALRQFFHPRKRKERR